MVERYSWYGTVIIRRVELVRLVRSLTWNANYAEFETDFTFCAVALISISITAVTSFSHLLNLESLDISNNNIDSLRRKFSNTVKLSSVPLRRSLFFLSLCLLMDCY